jgi:hypothetical protein
MELNDHETFYQNVNYYLEELKSGAWRKEGIWIVGTAKEHKQYKDTKK